MRRRWLVPVFLLVAGLPVWLWLQWLAQDIELKPYSLIEDNLYVGGSVKEPPAGTRAVLNLCQFEDPYQVEVCRADPIDGSQTPSIDWLWQVVNFIDEQRKAGKPIYIHCLAGMNRSGMVV